MIPKKLSKEKREEFYEHIIEQSLDYNIGIIEPSEIDQINIFQATKKSYETSFKWIIQRY